MVVSEHRGDVTDAVSKSASVEHSMEGQAGGVRGQGVPIPSQQLREEMICGLTLPTMVVLQIKKWRHSIPGRI